MPVINATFGLSFGVTWVWVMALCFREVNRPQGGLLRGIRFWSKSLDRPGLDLAAVALGLASLGC